MRTCSQTTKVQIVALDPKTIKHPPHSAATVAAAWDALHDRPMSAKRERRLRLALGLEPSTRPAVRRPWMGAELSAEMDAAGVTDATVRWLVTRHIFERELADAGQEGGM